MPIHSQRQRPTQRLGLEISLPRRRLPRGAVRRIAFLQALGPTIHYDTLTSGAGGLRKQFSMPAEVSEVQLTCSKIFHLSVKTLAQIHGLVSITLELWHTVLEPGCLAGPHLLCECIKSLAL